MSFANAQEALQVAASSFLDSDAPARIGAWLGTYLVHGVCLFVLAAMTAQVVRSARIREQLWRAALFGPLFTASLQIGAGLDPMGGVWSVPVLDPQGATPASGEVALTPEPMAAWGEAELLARMDHTAEELLLAYGRMQSVDAQGASPASMEPPAPAMPANPRQWSKLLPLAALAAGIAALMIRALVEALRMRALGRRHPLMSGPAARAVQEIAKEAGIRRPLRVEVTESHISPYATGVLFPSIVLPTRALNELDTPSMRAMLAHEVGHVARFDPLWTAAARSVSALFFFQPLNGYITRRMDQCAEFCCDEFAVGVTGDEVALARCLTTVADWILRPEGSPRPACGMAHRDSPLAERVDRILETEGEVARPLGPLRLAGGAAVLATALAAPGLAAPEVDPAHNRASPSAAPAVKTLYLEAVPAVQPGPFAELIHTVRALRADVESLVTLAEDRDVSPETMERLQRLSHRARRITRIAEQLGASAR